MILGNRSPKQSEALKRCETLLSKISAHRNAVHFLQPVDPIALRIPDYPKIVRDPMDLGTIKKKLKAREYLNPSEMLIDLNKVWANSFLYNPVSSQMHAITKAIADYAEALIPEFIEDKYEEFSLPRPKFTKEKSKDSGEYMPPGIKIPFPGSMADRPLSYEEKRTLTEMIKSTIGSSRPQSRRNVQSF